MNLYQRSAFGLDPKIGFGISFVATVIVSVILALLAISSNVETNTLVRLMIAPFFLLGLIRFVWSPGGGMNRMPVFLQWCFVAVLVLFAFWK